MYTWGFSDFGKNGFYPIFQIYNFVAETILRVFTLMTVNMYTVRKLNEYVKKRKRITKKTIGILVRLSSSKFVEGSLIQFQF